MKCRTRIRAIVIVSIALVLLLFWLPLLHGVGSWLTSFIWTRDDKRIEYICQIRQGMLGAAILEYQETGDGGNPDIQEIRGLIVDSNTGLFCAASVVKKNRAMYVYRGSDLRKDAHEEMILLYCNYPWHNGRRNVLFADLQVRALTEESFEKAIYRDNQLRRQLDLSEKALGGN